MRLRPLDEDDDDGMPMGDVVGYPWPESWGDEHVAEARRAARLQGTELDWDQVGGALRLTGAQPDA